MGKIKSHEFPDVVIRPSGVWDSRAPFHDFLNQHRLENRIYYIGVLTIEKLRYELRQLPTTNPARSFFAAKDASPISGRAWRAYKLSFPRNPNEPPIHPTLAQTSQDLSLLSLAYNEHAIVSYSSLFELFAQCWALNCLLSKLENNESWSQSERCLAMDFCPILNNGHIPTVLNIGKAIPLLADSLSNLPHVNTDPKTNVPIDSPLTPNLNSWRIILFWRDWRNLLIHRSGLISNQFFDRHSNFYNEYIECCAYLPSMKSHLSSLKVGDKLTLNDTIFKGIVATHYKAAGWMNQYLEKISLGRRGQPYAPDKKPEGSYWHNPPARSPALLIEGDHKTSLQWLDDEGYRAELSRNLLG